jgi:hypothetical protein
MTKTHISPWSYYVYIADAFGVSRKLAFAFLCLSFYQCSLIASSISMFLVLSMLPIGLGRRQLTIIGQFVAPCKFYQITL